MRAEHDGYHDGYEAQDSMWLREALGRAAADEPVTTTAQALQALHTARRSLRRRRTLQGLGAAAVAAVLIPVVPWTDPRGGDQPVVAAPTASSSVVRSVSASGDSSPSASASPRAVPQLDGDGLTVPAMSAPTPSRAVQVSFGSSSRARLQSALTAFLGGPPSVTRVQECGPGPADQLAWEAGLQLTFDGPRLVGWVDEAGVGATAGGVRVGTTLAELRRAFPGLTPYNDTLGPEWTTPNGVSGLLAGTSPTSKVTTLFAGVTCFAR